MQLNADLERMKKYDVEALGGAERLGISTNFVEVVPDLERMQYLYRQIPSEILKSLTPDEQASLHAQVTSDLALFQRILSFAHEFGTREERAILIREARSRPAQIFSAIESFILRGLLHRLDADQHNQKLAHLTNSFEYKLIEFQKVEEETKAALTAIREAAGETGVSQQAVIFNAEAGSQATSGTAWLICSIALGVLILTVATGGLFLHKWEWIQPLGGRFEKAQFLISKVMILALLMYFLVTSVRVYLSHKHNAIVNRHRQNALMTYRALLEGSDNQNTRDIVLAHAAACIFSPQDTGFSSKGSDGLPSNPRSVLELMTRSSPKDGG